MIKLGILDFDTSHVVEFTKRLNHLDIAEEQWVDGATVVAACPGESKIAAARIPGFVEGMKKLKVPLVDKPADLIGKVDGVLVESLQGAVHLERARPFLEAGLPCYIDKPFAGSAADARRIVELAAKHKVPVFSSSSLRYAPELAAFTEAGEKHGKTLGAVAWGPSPLDDGNPGLLHYGIHAVEILYTLMGPGCVRVTCTHEKDVDVVTGQWKDGRVGTVRGTRAGKVGYGATAFAENGVVPLDLSAKFIYRELLKRIVGMFETGKPPFDPSVTVELIAFIEAAFKSGNNHGAGETVSA